MKKKPGIRDLIKEKVLVLDGAMGTMIQDYKLSEDDFRGERFKDAPGMLQGNNDLLSLTRPDIIMKIHKVYLQAGADILETNTFNANRISMSDYHMESLVYEMNRAAAGIARRAADEFTAKTPGKPRYVAGSLGPTNKTASLSSKVEDPGFREVNFDILKAAYKEQAEGLVDGGVEMFLIETIFDTLNAKAALLAVKEAMKEKGINLPVMVSGTLTDGSGRTLSGQTLEAFLYSVAGLDIFSIGLNCSLGAKELQPFVKELSLKTSLPVSVYPNAGLPNPFGEYDETPAEMSRYVKEFLDDRQVNIIGGCCGTTPDHIQSFVKLAEKAQPRPIPALKKTLQLSGLESLVIFPGSNFINIGERTNVAGSKRFARLIREENFEEALSVARQQVENGAQVLDINMDDPVLDAKEAMVRFLTNLASEPDIARVPVMIDSSKWEVIEAGLKCLQGKGIVNSISLKEGETVFIEHARKIKNYGAAVIVMAFDEQGQAVSYERKTEICKRAYEILTREVHFPAEDIIFDPNILTIATGMTEHNEYAINFLKATRWIRKNLPGTHVSGGISNLSFSFRGNNPLREAMHSVFLYHAIQAGMEMGIVNAGALPVYDEIPEKERNLIEDVLFNRDEQATERLIEFAHKSVATGETETKTDLWREKSLESRIQHALVKGVHTFIEEDMQEALEVYPSALNIIEGPLMKGMNIVGDLFGEGKMFLPQVIKSARVMKKAVAVLSPVLEVENAGKGPRKAGKILLATVKGDVHDIGKNIVGLVLGCNNFEVIDLGVMVPSEKILETAQQEKVDIVGLSGLITPSLEEMGRVAKEMNRAGLDIPLLIGGATTSLLHTAVKIQPGYPNGVIQVKDASRSVQVVSTLLSKTGKKKYLQEIDQQYKELRDTNMGIKRKLIPLEEARSNRFHAGWEDYIPVRPTFTGVKILRITDLREISSYINWTFFFHVWEMKGRYPDILSDPEKGEEATKLYKDARKMLERILAEQKLTAEAVLGIYPANSKGDDIYLFKNETRKKPLLILNQLRQQRFKKPGESSYCLADFVAPLESGIKDYHALFVATAGKGLEYYLDLFRKDHDDYSGIMVKALADRLAEAFTEWLHLKVRKEFWGFAPGEHGSLNDLFLTRYQGIRPAFGYPACPDHSEKRKVFDFLKVEQNTIIRLTDRFSMFPGASVSGHIMAHPRSKYFDVGKIAPDQFSDYVKRKNLPEKELKKNLLNILVKNTNQ